MRYNRFTMYDAFSSDYDRFVNWKGRLGFELPFIVAQLQAAGVGNAHGASAGEVNEDAPAGRMLDAATAGEVNEDASAGRVLNAAAGRILDAATAGEVNEDASAGRVLNAAAGRILDAAAGTGMHAIALAGLGYRVAGADLSPGMVAQARQNAAQSGAAVEFVTAGFGKLAAAFGIQSKSGYAQPDDPIAIKPTSSGPRNLLFDALLCLGNSLPHLLDLQSLAQALQDFGACLRPGGLLLIQNRNFDAVLATKQRWMEPQAHQEGQSEWLFIRFYDYRPDGLIDFNILTLKRQAGAGWEQRVHTTQLYPQRQSELLEGLQQAGFVDVVSYGGLDGSPFDPAASGNLVLAARKA